MRTRLHLAALLILFAMPPTAEAVDKALSRKEVCNADCQTARQRKKDADDGCSSASKECARDVKSQEKICLAGCKGTKDADNDTCNVAEPSYRNSCREAVGPAFEECKTNCSTKTYSCDSAKLSWQTEACNAATQASSDATGTCNACKEL